MDSVETLMRMKNEIEENKSKKARLEGELDSILSSLDDMGIGSIDEAEAKLKTLEEEEEKLDGELKEQVDKLMESYDWSFA